MHSEMIKLDHYLDSCPQFKQCALEIVTSGYKNVKELAEEYNLHPTTLCQFDFIFRRFLL